MRDDPFVVVTGDGQRGADTQEQGRSSFRGMQSAHSRVLRRDGCVYAAFRSTCMNCKSTIDRGNKIVFDAVVGKFVHASCARAMAVPETPTLSSRGEVLSSLPAGVRPRTLATYRTEWARYEALAKRRGYVKIPGMDGPWDVQLLWAYLSFRSETCKPHTVTAGLSALAYFGARFGYLLPTSKNDSNSLLYRQIAMLKQQLVIDHSARRGGVRYEISRCTPLGFRTVALILSAFRIRDRASFMRLSRGNRHHVALTVMQHSAAMRFGHFPAREYKLRHFAIDGRLGDVTMVTDWHRYAGRRRYKLHFPAVPDEACRWYPIRDGNGEVVVHVTAAQVLKWHFAQLRQAGEQRVFAPSAHVSPSRMARQNWLRAVLLEALPLHATTARELVTEVTPHSFRPGMAADYLKEGWQLDAIAIRCRWQGTRNARMYAERTLLFDTRRDNSFRFVAPHWAC